MTQNASRKNWQYDFLRVIGMLSVMLFHYTAQYSKTVQQTAFAVFFSQGVSTFAVTMFFLMNGSLSYRSLKDDELSSLHYLKKRAVRLVPTYWLCLTVTSIVLTMTGTSVVSPKQFLLNAILANRVFKVPFVDGVYWYLLILLVFTVFITVAKWLRTPGRKKTLFILYGVAFLGFGLYNRVLHPFPEILAFALFQYLNKCLVGVAFGCLLYEWRSLCRRERLEVVLYIAALLFGEFFWFDERKVLAEMAGFAVFAMVLCFGGRLQLGPSAESFLGKIAGESYYVYLIHQQIGFVIIKCLISLKVNCDLAVLLTIGIIFISACLHHFLAEWFEPVRKKMLGNARS
ncbi:MAG: acyltransferase [Oscillospiraceae bacterium]|nr:acyltransferase [Oscillospiraceae bacterium]